MTPPLELAFTVACPPAHAFAVFAERIALWWPRGHSVSKDPDLRVEIEPFVGGRVLERTSGGDVHELGRVRAYDPPARLAYSWHLGQDPADATDVSVTFAPDASGGTLVRIEHGGWQRLGERGTSLRTRNRAGWDGVLGPYRELCDAHPA